MSDWKQEELEMLRDVVAKQRSRLAKMEEVLRESGYCANCEQCDGLVLDYKSKGHSDYCSIECEELAEKEERESEYNNEALEADYIRGR